MGMPTRGRGGTRIGLLSSRVLTEREPGGGNSQGTSYGNPYHAPVENDRHRTGDGSILWFGFSPPFGRGPSGRGLCVDVRVLPIGDIGL